MGRYQWRIFWQALIHTEEKGSGKMEKAKQASKKRVDRHTGDFFFFFAFFWLGFLYNSSLIKKDENNSPYNHRGILTKVSNFTCR